MANLLTNINRILGQYTWYNAWTLWAMFWIRRRKVSWGKTPTDVLPRDNSIVMRHNKLQSTIYIDTFTHNDHDGYVQFSTYLTQKRLSYQNARLIFINLRPPVVNSPYSPRYDPSNIPIYEIYSWKMVTNDRKITATILYIGSTLGNIYKTYAIVYCWYHWHLIIYDGLR